MKRLLVLCAFMLAAVAASAASDAWPDRPIKMIAGTAPGGTVDKIARSVGNHLQDRLGQPVVVDNRAGAGGTIAAEAAEKAAPDGYTLSIVSLPTVAITPVLEKVRYDPDDMAPVSLVGTQPYVLLVPAESKVKSVADLVAEAKAGPDSMSYASAGRGTASHLVGELFAQGAGVKLLHVPYKGIMAGITDVIGGNVSMVFATAASAQSLVDAKKLRPIATTGAQRSKAFPELPTMKEAGFPNAVVTTWYGVSAPPKTPAPIIDRLNQEINAWMADPQVQQQFALEGIELQGGTPAQFAAFMKAEQARWRKVLEAAGLARTQ